VGAHLQLLRMADAVVQHVDLWVEREAGTMWGQRPSHPAALLI
jgi:hypothetical protein